MDKETKEWACEKVSSFIGISSQECEPLIDRMWQLNSEDEIRNEFQNIIGNSVSTNIFINEFISKKTSVNNTVVQNVQSETINGRDSPFEYQKHNAEDYYTGGKKKKDKKEKMPENVEINHSPPKKYANEDEDEDDKVKVSKKQLKREKAKKKKGGISIDEWDPEDREKVTKGKNGRPMCPCLAAKHGLVTNCLNCGKIICKLEGVGPCSFCGNEVIDNEQQIRVYQQKQREKIRSEKQKLIKMDNNNINNISSVKETEKVNVVAGASSSSSSTSPAHFERPDQETIEQQRNEKLVLKLEVQSEMAQKELAFEKAREQKEKLLDFDRNSSQRTKIYDTATDFDPNMTAAYNKWLSPQERIQAIKREQALREYEKNKKKNVKVAIDIKTKEIIELPPDPFEYKEETAEPSLTDNNNDQGTGYYINPFIKEIPKFVQVDLNSKKKEEKPKTLLEKKEEKRKNKKGNSDTKKDNNSKDNNKNKEDDKENKKEKNNKKKSLNLKGKTKNIRRIQYDIEDQELFGFTPYDYSDDEEEDGECNTENTNPKIKVDN